METTNNLSWTAIADKPWIHLNPSSGSGDKNIEVTVDNYDGYSEDVTGTVTVSCDACKITTEPTVIEVCRCACKCDNMTFTPTIARIPESGATVGTVLATYSILNRCSANRISAYIKNTRTGVQNSLNVGDNKISLKTAIPYNQEESDVTYDIVITFDGPEHECSTFQIVQDALECNCQVSIKRLVYESILTNGVPQSGIPANTKLLTYELKQYCPLSKLKVVLSYKDDDGVQRTRTLRLENGAGYLSTAISANNTVNNRIITATAEWFSETCSTQVFQQEGCKCETALVAESFDVSISTFGVTGGSQIGTYSMNPQNTCPESALTATLRNKSNVDIYTLVCNNGKVYLASSDEIAENITKECVNFELVVYYNGFECDRADICQKGVDCNCDDIRGKVSFYNSFITIQKEGMQAGTIVGEYRLTNPKCEDDNDCFKIEDNNEGEGAIQLQLINGQIKLLNDIPNNEDPAIITYSFTVYYKVNNKWRVCDTISVTQKGLECSCKMVTVFGGQEWVSFPISGTRGLVRFGKADTGLYKYKGTPQEEIVGVCGSLSADCNCSTIIPHDGLNVTTVAVPLTQEEIDKGLEMPHLYEFYVDLGSTATTAPITQRADLYFIPKDGSPVETCETEAFGFKYDPDACNCVMNNLSQTGGVNGLTCEGYSTVSNLGTVSATHTAMTITAELLTDGQEYDICEDTITSATYDSSDNVINLIGYGGFVVLSVDASQYLQEGETIINVRVSEGNLVISIRKTTTRTVTVSISELVEGKKYTKTDTTYITDFTYTYTSQTLTIKGKVASNMTSSKRIVGVVRVHYWCNKGSEVNEWYCGCKDFAILQNKGCTCDCDYVRARQGYTWYWDITFSHNETYNTIELNSDTSDCSYYYLAYADENGCITTGEDDWCKVCISKTYNGWVLSAEIVDGKHENRTTSVKIYSAYLSGYDEETHAPIYVDCDDYDINITDTKCDCDALNAYSFTNKTVTIPAGELPQSNSECWYNLFKISDCIELYIVGDDGTPTGTSSSNQYEYKENGEIIYTAYVFDNCVRVYLKKDLDPTKTYTFVVKARYKDENNEWQYCDPSATVTVKQKTCDCNAFKQKVSIDYYGFYYDQTYTQLERTLDVATASTGCGKATLFIKYGGNKYCANDLNGGNWPDELNYILGMSEPCSNGTLQLVVTPLDSEHTSRDTEIGVCLCKEELTDSCRCDESDCEKTGTITERWSFDCSNVYCNDYNWYLQREASGEYQVPCGGVSGALIATYPTPPECFSVELVSSHNAIHPYKQAIDANTVGIYINADAVDKKESPTVDVHVYKDGSICSSLSQEYIKITLCG